MVGKLWNAEDELANLRGSGATVELLTERANSLAGAVQTHPELAAEFALLVLDSAEQRERLTRYMAALTALELAIFRNVGEPVVACPEK